MRWFGRLSMNTRLGIGFALIAVALAAVGACAVWGLTTVSRHNQTLAGQVVPGLNNLRKFQYLQESLFTYSSSIMIAPDLKAAQDYLPGRAETKAGAPRPSRSMVTSTSIPRTPHCCRRRSRPGRA